MAQYGNKYGSQTDEYGNPVRQTDEYGNPLAIGPYMNQPGVTTIAATGGHGTHGGGIGATGVGMGTGTGHLRSSSSSEDDGMGGRRKKGLKEKVKEKLPGHHKDEQGYAAGATTTPAGGVGYEQGHEKKGMMEKIKEKLPGGHH